MCSMKAMIPRNQIWGIIYWVSSSHEAMTSIYKIHGQEKETRQLRKGNQIILNHYRNNQIYYFFDHWIVSPYILYNCWHHAFKLWDKFLFCRVSQGFSLCHKEDNFL